MLFCVFGDSLYLLHTPFVLFFTRAMRENNRRSGRDIHLTAWIHWPIGWRCSRDRPFQINIFFLFFLSTFFRRFISFVTQRQPLLGHSFMLPTTHKRQFFFLSVKPFVFFSKISRSLRRVNWWSRPSDIFSTDLLIWYRQEPARYSPEMAFSLSFLLSFFKIRLEFNRKSPPRWPQVLFVLLDCYRSPSW